MHITFHLSVNVYNGGKPKRPDSVQYRELYPHGVALETPPRNPRTSQRQSENHCDDEHIFSTFMTVTVCNPKVYDK